MNNFSDLENIKTTQLLNETGEKILALKNDYVLVSDSTKDVLDNHLKDLVLKKQLSNDIIEKIKDNNLSYNDFKNYLLEQKKYILTNVDLIDRNRKVFSQILEKVGVKYFSTSSDNENIYIVRKIGIGKNFAKTYFQYPDLIPIPTYKGRLTKNKKQEIEKVKEQNERIEKEMMDFLEKFAELRLPIVADYIIKNVSENLKRKKIKIERTKVYKSEVINYYNIDLKITIPHELLVQKIEYEKDREKFIFFIQNLLIMINDLYLKKINE